MVEHQIVVLGVVGSSPIIHPSERLPLPRFVHSFGRRETLLFFWWGFEGLVFYLMSVDRFGVSHLIVTV